MVALSNYILYFFLMKYVHIDILAILATLSSYILNVATIKYILYALKNGSECINVNSLMLFIP